MNDIVKEFLVESYDNLDRLDRDFIDLEKDAENKDTLSSIFRTIHTIKGTCGFLGFKNLESLAHVAENLLAKLRDGTLPVTPEMVSALLAAVDGIRTMLRTIEETETDGKENYQALKDKLTRMQSQDWQPAPQAHTGKPATEAKAPHPAKLDEEEKSGIPFGSVLVEEGKIQPDQLDLALRRQSEGDPRRVGEILVEQGVIKPDDVKVALKKQEEQKGNVADSSVRIDVVLLDRLMNLVGELVLERNRILQFGQGKDPGLNSSVQRLNRITSELQEGVMKTRMQQVGNIWNKFPRVVRDLAMACGKKIRLELEGKETELDRTLLEAIKDPLTHLIRNSVDHGVETPEARRAARKPEEGVILLRAFHEGGLVIMEIQDDGGGINPVKIKNKAIEKNLITSAEAERMDDNTALQLIFLPGFSTAEKVTNVSGRGVGMDVVKTNIEKIGGQVDIASVVGKGTTFRLKIPLTLAIVPALIVMAGGERYAIPQVALRELIRIENGEGMETIQDRHFYRLRGSLLPLLFLSHELGIQSQLDLQKTLKIVVLHADGKTLGLVVEDIRDTEEIVVKPLGKQLKSVDIFAGATIMGDGKVALILDIAGMARRGHADINLELDGANAHDSSRSKTQENLTTLLLLRTPDDGRMVIPLSQVARLEEFQRSTLEHAGNLHVVRYRDEIMPIIPVMDWLPERRGEKRAGDRVDIQANNESLNVVVYNWEGRNVGLLVDEILDILDHPFQVQPTASRDGVEGTIVVHDKVTEVLDIRRIIELGDPTFFRKRAAEPARNLEALA
jgi:two-component system, chemotaxis family, sensor kinase CheA